ncbi:MAG: sigma-54-dependent Fis family transcriptional regulator [Granulosicoccus sp.]|nr:sigma-54-dependent Fis family transcriptional regulator [Granulosicoccus sp.]
MGKEIAASSEDSVSEDSYNALFAHPGKERDILHAWENFLSGVTAVGPSVRVVVERSWKRSSMRGVNARLTQSPVVYSEASFHVLRQRNQLLRNAAVETLREHSELLAGTRSILILSDPGGVVLDVAGDPGTIDQGHDINLTLGGSWNEGDVGTNAIGTAIATDRAVQIHASEHFCEGVKKWTCAAAPIHDPRDQSLLGILDISGPDISYCQQNLALALTAAKQIEMMLVEQLLAERAHLLEACLSSPSYGNDGVILFDQTGCVVYTNNEANRQMSQGAISSSLRPGTRVAGHYSSPTLRDLANGLPPGMSADWLHPVTLGNQTLGSLLLIPSQPTTHVPKLAPKHARLTSTVKTSVATKDAFSSIVGTADTIRDAKARAQRIAGGSAPVLIEGETGVGKELFARAIHAASKNSTGPLVTYNCGALSKELIGSELFGYVKGAFTGAHTDGRVGRFELANGGTLCLDEIGEMPLELQPYLLRVLDEGIVYRLGDNKPRKIDVRLVVMTNRNLREEVDAGRFRQDLFYRICVAELSIPPLRTRGDDVIQLIHYFNDQLSAKNDLPPANISEQALEALCRHDWPGNVRELRNVIESVMLTCSNTTVDLRDLPDWVLSPPTHAGGNTPAQPVDLESSQKQAIEAAMQMHAGNLTRAAKQLGISRSTLYRKIDHFKIAENKENKKSKKTDHQHPGIPSV